VSNDGLLGDRRYALMDRSDGKIVTAKNPRKWPNLYSFSASLGEPAETGARGPSLRITFPDGRVVTGAQADLDAALSRAVSREVALVGAERGLAAGKMPASAAKTSEAYWPDIDGLEHRGKVTEFQLHPGTFFDGAPIHLLTTATLHRLGQSYPGGRFDPRRFRPNIVITPANPESGFAEEGWIGRILAIGDAVRLSLTRPCGRCVMTTLAQRDLPTDGGILRTVVQENKGFVGIYATVLRGGTIRRGDPVRLSAA